MPNNRTTQLHRTMGADVIDVYDINIYCSNNILHLTAYKLVRLGYDGNTLRSEMNESVTLRLPMDEAHFEEVAYLLDSEDWFFDVEEWDEYDFWDTTDYLKVGNTPELIKNWVESLPPYTPRWDF